MIILQKKLTKTFRFSLSQKFLFPEKYLGNLQP